jgi:hypothetical protein
VMNKRFMERFPRRRPPAQSGGAGLPDSAS